MALTQIKASNIEDGTVVAAEIATNAVTTIKINADAIDGTKIADDAINSEHYTDASIDEAHIAADAVNFVTHLKAGTDGELITWNASGNPAAVPVGTAGHVLTSGGTGVAPTFVAAAAGGKIVQVVNTSVTSVVTGTTAMPVDNTIPQSGEGVELITRAITPTSASNKLLFFVSLEIKNTNTGGIQTIALFQDSTANALAAVYGKYMYASANQWPSQSFQHYMTAGTTSSTTFKIRSGQDGSGTTTLNGQAGNRLYGGVSSSNLTIMEISI